MYLFAHHHHTCYTCLVVGVSAIGALTLSDPVQAAAFSRASGEFQIDFLAIPPEIGTLTFTDSEVISSSGLITATSEATADFEILESSAVFNTHIVSAVEGSGQRFSGFAESLGFGDGLFTFEAGETFAFNFFGKLVLETRIDDGNKESAFANGAINLFFINESDPQALPESLQIFTFLETGSGAEEPLPLINSQGSFTVTSSLTRDLEGLEESALLTFQGSYNKTFESFTELRLEEAVLFGSSEIQTVPGPSILWGLASVCSVSLLNKLRQHSESKTDSSLSKK